MQNPPTAGSRGACQLGGDSAPYTPNQRDAQTADRTARTCRTCRHFLDYSDRSNRGECRRAAPQLVDVMLSEAVWPKPSRFDWCGEWEGGE